MSLRLYTPATHAVKPENHKLGFINNKFASIDTAYLTPGDVLLLLNHKTEHVMNIAQDHGICVVVPGIPELFHEWAKLKKDVGFSDRFITIMHELCLQGQMVAWFDEDGGEIAGMPRLATATKCN